MRAHDGADSRGRGVRRTRDQSIRRRDRGHSVVKARLGPVTAAHVEDNRADAAPHRHLGPHAVRPEPVDLAVLQGPCGGHAEVHARALRTGHRRNRNLVPRKIDARGNEETAQAHLDPRRGADAAALSRRRDIAALAAEVPVHDQEPVHALRLRARAAWRPPIAGMLQSAECADPPTKSTVPSRKAA